MVPEVLLQTSGLMKRYGGLVAINNLSFSVARGEIYGIIGPNGAGKTTLFSLLIGAQEPTAGAILFKGAQINGLKTSSIVQRGMVRTHQIVKPFRELSVFENVLVGASFGARPRAGAQARRAASDALEFCELSHRARVPAGSLSIGELKRLEVARALATDAEAILMDEVMGGQTPAEIDRAMALICQVRNAGKTVLMIEHHMKAVAGICDRVLVLRFGELIAEGNPQQVFSAPAVIEAYLGEPTPGRREEGAHAVR